MKYLFIDTSATNSIVAVIIDNQIKSLQTEINKQDLSANIMVMIDTALKESKISPKEINKIFVTNGPGSFTGIRIGVTVAKTWAYSNQIPVIPLSSLEVIASSNTSGDRIALIDARRGYVYSGVYDKNLNNIEKDKYQELEILKQKYNYPLFSYDFDDCLKPKPDILKIINKHENDKSINPHDLNPNYLKITEAESNLKAKND